MPWGPPWAPLAATAGLAPRNSRSFAYPHQILYQTAAFSRALDYRPSLRHSAAPPGTRTSCLWTQ
eukprot:5578035-Pyramimonas_sp.AAC.1